MLVKYEIILLINFLIITNLIDSSNSFSLFKSLFGKRIKRLYHSIPCQSVLREQAGKIEDTLQIPNDQLPYVCRRTIECPINPKTNLPMSLYLQVQSFQTGSCSIGDGITIVTIDSPIPARFCKDNVKPSPNTLFYPSGRAIIVSKSSNGGRHSINVRYACAGKSLNIPGLQAQKTTIKLIPNALPYGTTAKPFSLFDYVKPPVIGGTTAINRMYTRFPGGPLVIENMLPGLPNLELPNPANLVTQPNIGVYTLPSWFTLSGGRTLPPGFTFRLPPGQTMDPRIFETTPTIPYYTLPPWFTLPGNRTMPPGYIFTLPNGGTLPPNFFVTTTTPKVYTLPQWFTLPGGRTMPPGYTFTLPYGM
ncbi:hypothetical protein SNEBB_002601 [Seison nebaliae]|nr:hypothetical protein SNEBB_002601 [Seison nebaliae]